MYGKFSDVNNQSTNLFKCLFFSHRLLPSAREAIKVDLFYYCVNCKYYNMYMLFIHC